MQTFPNLLEKLNPGWKIGRVNHRSSDSKGDHSQHKLLTLNELSFLIMDPFD